MFSDSFAGIAPASVAGFVVAQLFGALIGLGVHRALGAPRCGHPNTVESSGEVDSAELI